MIGDTVIVGAGTSGNLDAALGGMSAVDVFKAGTQGTDQLQLLECVHFSCRQSGRAIGQDHLDLARRSDNRRRATLLIRRIQDGKGFADDGLAFFGKVDQ
jgi:hypothetical protein